MPDYLPQQSVGSRGAYMDGAAGAAHARARRLRVAVRRWFSLPSRECQPEPPVNHAAVTSGVCECSTKNQGIIAP